MNNLRKAKSQNEQPKKSKISKCTTQALQLYKMYNPSEAVWKQNYEMYNLRKAKSQNVQPKQSSLEAWLRNVQS